MFYVVDVEMGTFRRLFDRDSGGRVRTNTGAVSRDGKLCLGATNGSDAGDSDRCRRSSDWGRAGRCNPSARQSTGRGTGLAVSPDGETLAAAVFTKTWAAARIFTIPVDGSNSRELFDRYQTGWVPDAVRWTPDGRAILFLAHDANRNWRVMRVPADGGQPAVDGLSYETFAPLIPEHRMWPGNFNNIDVSPDGTRIIASTLTFSKQEIWTSTACSAWIRTADTNHASAGKEDVRRR